MNFRKKALASLAVLLVCIGSRSALAQEKQSDNPIKVQTTLVSVPVIVSDRQGRYISGLKLSDFKLYQDRIEQTIAVFEASEEPLNIALLLDTSRSTEEVLDDIKKEAANFLKELRPQDRAMVISFDYEVHVLSGLTSDRRVLDRAIKKASMGEEVGTTLRDAVAAVIARHFRRIDGRKAIILLTDGKDVGSRIAEQALLDEAAESGSMIYTVFFETGFLRRGWIDALTFPRRRVWVGRDRFPPRRPRRGDRRRQRVDMKNDEAVRFLTNLSDVSAGRFYSSEVSDLKKTFKLVADELRHQYRLGFYPDPTKADGQRHALRVQVNTPDTVVRARRSYQAPASGS
ncbi:MAG: VWA domain-containing protein [Acidobacteriota bacterium]